jgi:hypothetical protein
MDLDEIERIRAEALQKLEKSRASMERLRNRSIWDDILPVAFFIVLTTAVLSIIFWFLNRLF